MNRFLEDGECVKGKPFVDYDAPTKVQMDDLKEWCEEVRALGRKASERVLAACDAARENKRRKILPYVQGICKRLIKIPPHKFMR